MTDAVYAEQSLARFRQAALEALRANDFPGASRVMKLELPSFFSLEGWLWEIRLDRVRRSPGHAPWLVRAAVLEPDRVVVGPRAVESRR